MKKFEKTSGKKTLTIIIDEKSMLDELNKDIQAFTDLIKSYDEYKAKLDPSETPKTPSEYYKDFVYDYDMQSVYEDVDSWVKPEDIIKDLNEFKDIITKSVESDGSKLWDKIVLKKNGTFNKTCKPTLKEATNGCYWDDSYGWNTRVLRLVAHDDVTVHMQLDEIVLHY